jgi:hypothetical protein
MVSVTGRCQKLVVGGQSYTKDCQPKLVNVSYPNGRLGFWFLLPKKSILSFSGPSLPNPTPNTGESIVDQVVFQLGGSSTPTSNDPAQGRCTYANPIKPMTIRCQGVMRGGVKFLAIFRTDGKPPR